MWRAAGMSGELPPTALLVSVLNRNGTKLDQFGTFGVVESVKAVSDLFAPVSGEVAEANDELSATPELVNSDPYGAGWMIRVKVADAGQIGSLLEPEAYERLTTET